MRSSVANSIVFLLQRIAPRLSDKQAEKLGRCLGVFGMHLLRKHRRRSLKNVSIAFGGLSMEDREAIVRETYAHFGAMLFEVLRFSKITKENFKNYVEYEGLENLSNAHKRGRGVIVCSGHFGNWELVALAQGYAGYPMTVVTRKLDDPYLEKILGAIRRASGNEIVHKRRAAPRLVSVLGSGGIVGIVTDQNFRDEDKAVFVNFFGHPAATTPIAAMLAIKTGAALVPVFSVPLGGGRYKIIYESEVPVPSEGDRESKVFAVTQEISDRLENYVKKYPHLWLWMHNRWRTKPKERTEDKPKEREIRKNI